MNNKEFLDVRCILLCKSFQAKKSSQSSYFELSEELKNSFGDSFEQYSIFGEYDGVFSFKLQNDKNSLLRDINNNNKALAKHMSDSIFFKSLYLIYPANENYSEETDRFWKAQSPFFLTTIIHMNHCSANLETKKSGREYIIKTIDEKKKEENVNWSFRYRVYYSLDLSDYIIVWKTNEPAHVLEAIRFLYEDSDLIGYTNTLCALPTKNFKDINSAKKMVGKTNFSMSIQAVAKSYREAQKTHLSVVSDMKNKYNISSSPSFSMGNDDYLGYFPDVSPEALYDLYYILMNEPDFDKAILSLNTTLAIDGYFGSSAQKYSLSKNILTDEIKELFENAQKFKTHLSKACYELKEEYIDLFKNNPDVFENFFWKKTLLELLVLLDNMSKSTVFDSACFLFFDSIHLFLAFLKHLRQKYTEDKELIYALIENELHIETFIREWEQLINHVVQIDGAFQRTPGYEPLNYNTSEGIVEFHNAFSQKVISYFSSLDEIDENKPAHISSFVVPKLCRRFKTTQWFFDNRKNDSLLFITIPVSQMFETFSNMIALTHEICHYCSNDVRMRNVRTDTLLLSVAILICRATDLNSNDTIKKAYELLKLLFERENNNDYNCYLNDLTIVSKKIAFKFLDKTDGLNELFYTYLNEYTQNKNKPIKDKAQLAMKVRRASTHLIGLPDSQNDNPFDDVSSIYGLIDNLIILIKESYADFMMAYVLSLKPEQYLTESFRELVRIREEEHERVYSKYERVFVVCNALLQSGYWTTKQFEVLCKDDTDFDINQNKYCKEFLDIFVPLMHREHPENEEFKDYFFINEILEAIVQYLKICFVQIKKREKENHLETLKEEISKLFDIMTSNTKEGLFSEAFQNELQNNRKNVLEKWSSKETTPYFFG